MPQRGEREASKRQNGARRARNGLEEAKLMPQGVKGRSTGCLCDDSGSLYNFRIRVSSPVPSWRRLYS